MKYVLLFFIDLVKDTSNSKQLSSAWGEIIFKAVNTYISFIINEYRDNEGSKWKIIGLVFSLLTTSNKNYVLSSISQENQKQLPKLTLYLIGHINCAELMGFANYSKYVMNWVDVLSLSSVDNLLEFTRDNNVKEICVKSLMSTETMLCGCSQNIVTG
jgi:hypothetical protein